MRSPDYIAHAEFCADKILKSRSIQLFSQPADIHRQRVFVNEAVRFPQCLHELFTADDLALVLHERE